ncbi:hypothetical protein EDC04DRAFT_2866090 [Pisolithus marmoratus]|nr:hypothetical protein EDC04DRAFT_2866090 [Pisolithus marmoratus]
MLYTYSVIEDTYDVQRRTARLLTTGSRDHPLSYLFQNPDLVRLTGKHPFNCEARLSSLFDAVISEISNAQGFLTPAHLHYVRNHGAVPRVSEQMAVEWALHIHGLVQREATFTLQQLSESFPVVTLPVTFVCAGNRRKEQNVVRKTLGFSWGAAGLSTALWTGVYLADVLAYVKPIRREAKHIIFEGGDHLPNGPYGTSQLLSWAADKNKGMLLAWAMNGLPLEPDHGFPLRVVIPGQIGGRSVKWLNGIEISNGESQHHVVSIAKPDHDETLVVAKRLLSCEVVPSYSIRGYAYAGGGRRVTRVEVSLDEGITWALGRTYYFRQLCHEDPAYGTLNLSERDTSFCWCFWSFDVKYDALIKCNALACSALQPRDMYWHSLGMMNNWWFRVANEIVLRFEHPTLAGTEPGGWMEVSVESVGSGHHETQCSERLPLEKRLDTSNQKWRRLPLTKPGDHSEILLPGLFVNGEVYDGTPFLNEHPGGSDSITLVAGQDASEDFFAIHSAEGKAKLAQFHIGTLIKSGAENADPGDETSDGPFLECAKWKDVKLTRIVQVNHDSFLYLFELPRPDQPLGLPVGQHVFVRLKRKDTGEVVQRAYTPVSREGAVGSIEFLIKLYLPSATSPGGKMTTGFYQLQLGDTVQLKGPLGSFIWNGLGVVNWKGSERKIKEVGMICGGSGITPILQVLRSIFNDDGDTETRVWVISANRTEEDILCRDELDTLFARHGPHRLKLHYILDNAPATWKGSVGFIDEQLLKAHMPGPSEHGIILVCGPGPMITRAVKPGLKAAGWDIENHLVVF